MNSELSNRRKFEGKFSHSRDSRKISMPKETPSSSSSSLYAKHDPRYKQQKIISTMLVKPESVSKELRYLKRQDEKGDEDGNELPIKPEDTSRERLLHVPCRFLIS